MKEWNETRQRQCSEQGHISFDRREEKAENLALGCLRVQISAVCKFCNFLVCKTEYLVDVIESFGVDVTGRVSERYS
jgi:hypothetical protein